MSRQKKRIRFAFESAVMERDGHQCAIPECTENAPRLALVAHHITDRHYMPHGGYVPENGITLCPKHHMAAEVWHESGHQLWVTGMKPDDLYRLIGSSKERALAASERL